MEGERYADGTSFGQKLPFHCASCEWNGQTEQFSGGGGGGCNGGPPMLWAFS